MLLGDSFGLPMPKDIHKTIENRLRSIAYKINEMISWSINDNLKFGYDVGKFCDLLSTSVIINQIFEFNKKYNCVDLYTVINIVSNIYSNNLNKLL